MVGVRAQFSLGKKECLWIVSVPGKTGHCFAYRPEISLKCFFHAKYQRFLSFINLSREQNNLAIWWRRVEKDSLTTSFQRRTRARSSDTILFSLATDFDFILSFIFTYLLTSNNLNVPQTSIIP